MSRGRTPTPFTRKLGGRVRALRKQHGWTMHDLAERCGLNHTYVAQVERGERNPSAWTIVMLAAGLGVSPGVLLQDLADAAHKGAPLNERLNAETH